VSADLVTYALWLAALLGTGGVVVNLLAITVEPAERADTPRRGSDHRGGADPAAADWFHGRAGLRDLRAHVALGHSPYVTTRRTCGTCTMPSPTPCPGLGSLRQRLRAAGHYGAVTGAARRRLRRGYDSGSSYGTPGRVRDRRRSSDQPAAPLARRLRAHLLWTVGPLLLWDLVAAGHLNVLAIMAGLLGLLVLGGSPPPPGRPGLARVWPAGALLGIATGYQDQLRAVRPGCGLGPAPLSPRPWLSRAPRPRGSRAQLRLLRDTSGRALLSWRNQSSADNFYRAFLRTPGITTSG
jgi:hypothetical protein